jgi:hypothetical protein
MSQSGTSKASPREEGDEMPPTQLDTTKQPSGAVKETDNMDSLVYELQKAIEQPEEVVDAGYAPVPYFFAFQPSSKYADQRQAFNGLLGMNAITRMFAAINIVTARKAQEQNNGYSITKPAEYISSFNEGTEATIKALTVGPLSTFYDGSSGGSTQTEDQSLKRSDIHNFVLTRIFGGLSQISKNQMKDLDKLLTDLVSMLKPYKAGSATDQSLLKHVVLINYIKATDITGNGSVFVIEPYTRMVALTIKAQEWTTALQKPGFLKKNEKIKFSMTTTISDLKLDEAKYRANKARYEQAMKLTVGDQPDLKKIIDEGGIEAYGHKTSYVWPAQETGHASSDEE